MTEPAFDPVAVEVMKNDLTAVAEEMGITMIRTARSLVAKDLRLFWRDPAQWSQFLLFFGIMALYLANLRGARSFAGQEGWRAWGTLLNLGASMLILASLTTRFIYPLISLEGRRFWILGLSPVTLRHIMWQKFWLSVGSVKGFALYLGLTTICDLLVCFFFTRPAVYLLAMTGWLDRDRRRTGIGSPIGAAS